MTELGIWAVSSAGVFLGSFAVLMQVGEGHLKRCALQEAVTPGDLQEQCDFNAPSTC